MLQVNHYTLLGVSRDASREDIRRAYRRLVRRWHPDVNGSSPDAAERLRQLNEAYGVLRDQTSREHYDCLLDLFPTPRRAGIGRSTIPASVAVRRRGGIAPILITLALAAVVTFVGLSFISGALPKWASRVIDFMRPEAAATRNTEPRSDLGWVVQHWSAVDGVADTDRQAAAE